MGMTGNGMVSGVDDWYLGRRYVGDGWTGGVKDSFGSAEGNTMVGDGSGLVRGTAKGGEAAEDEEGSENFRGRL